MMDNNENSVVNDIVDEEMKIKMANRPSKLAHIKNKNIINNSWDFINEKYVKKVWAHKRTKLDREKRDLIWEYYRYRNRLQVSDMIKKTYYKNVKDVTIIYFDDPVQYRFVITQEMIDKIRKYQPPKPPQKKKEKKERKKKKLLPQSSGSSSSSSNNTTIVTKNNVQK